MSVESQGRNGALFAVSAFLMWGLAPIYFKQLITIDSLEILAHRVVWSVVFLLIVICAVKQWHQVQVVLKSPKLLLMLAGSSCLLGFNWWLFIWSVNNNHLLDASLGYYINPLLNVLLGMLVLGERLRRWQKVAVGIATTGVVIQIIAFGSFPVIAMTLAGSFAIYGLVRKKIPVDSLPGLFIEAIVLLPVGLVYWYLMGPSDTSNLGENSWNMNLLLMSAGAVTTLPLLCFTAAAKRLQYATLGFFQYIAPSLMFLLAVQFYGEIVGLDRILTFVCIWSALALYAWDSYRLTLRNKR